MKREEGVCRPVNALPPAGVQRAGSVQASAPKCHGILSGLGWGGAVWGEQALPFDADLVSQPRKDLPVPAPY